MMINNQGHAWWTDNVQVDVLHDELIMEMCKYILRIVEWLFSPSFYYHPVCKFVVYC